MSPIVLLLYCSLIATASIVGGWIPSRWKLSHLRIQLTTSFVAGVMLGVSVLHLLPHGIVLLDKTSQAAEAGQTVSVATLYWAFGAMLAGILLMFFLNRLFHFQQHEFSDDAPQEHDAGSHRDHDHHQHQRDTNWLGLAFGLSVHSLIDGVALAAAVHSEAGRGFSYAGLSIFVAIILHKPLDAISIVSLMKSQGWPESRQVSANIGFAMMCPLGAGLFMLGLLQEGDFAFLLGITLSFSAGVFSCIALGDLLPEVHFHSHDKFKLSAALLLGIAVAVGIEVWHARQLAAIRNDNNEVEEAGAEPNPTTLSASSRPDGLPLHRQPLSEPGIRPANQVDNIESIRLQNARGHSGQYSGLAIHDQHLVSRNLQRLVHQFAEEHGHRVGNPAA